MKKSTAALLAVSIVFVAGVVVMGVSVMAQQENIGNRLAVYIENQANDTVNAMFDEADRQNALKKSQSIEGAEDTANL